MDIDLREVRQQLLDLTGNRRDLIVLRLDLMKNGSRRVRHEFQPHIKDTGNQALCVKPAAETFADEPLAGGLIAEPQQFIRFGLSKFLINRNDDRHGKVVRGLVVPNQYVDYRSDGHPANFDWSPRIEAF